MRKKKNGEGKGIPVLFALLLCCVSILPDLQVQAAQEDKLGIVAAYDENGNKVVNMGGAAVQMGDTVYVLTDAAVYRENSSYVYTDSARESHRVEPAGTCGSGELMMKFTDSGAGAAGVMEVTGAVRYQTANFVYFDAGNGRLACMKAQFIEAEDRGDYTAATIKTEGECEYTPLAVLVSDDGGCLGFAVGSGEVHIFNSEKTFYGTSPGGIEGWFSENALPIGVGCMAAVGVYLYRKKGKKVSSAVSVQEDIPVYQDSAMEASAEPFWEEYPAAGPVDDIPPTVPFQNEDKLFLAGIGGCMNGRIYPIGQEEITIGRSSSSVIRYPDETKGVSRKHCKVYKSGGGYRLVDHGSSYGTFLKGYGRLTEHEPVEVKCGDTFYIGSEKNGFTIGRE